MYTPNEIIDLLQPIVSIYFYDIQHKNRTILLLSDNISEISCKLKILQKSPGENVKKIEFPKLLEKVNVPPELGDRLLKYHKLRNEFQHRSPYYTIEGKTAADSVIATLDLIKGLWEENTFDEIPNWVRCGLRVIKLFSSKGNMEKRNNLERKILTEVNLYLDNQFIDSNILINEDGEFVKGDTTGGGIERRLPNKNEAIVQVCLPKYWTFLFHNHTSKIEQILNEIGIEDI